jgi:very-short-patch-repair endonuclease
LAIEIDGEIHRGKNQIEHDIERTTFLEGNGVHLIRFRNEEVQNQLGQVIKRILEIVDPHLSSPSPDSVFLSGEGERG